MDHTCADKNAAHLTAAEVAKLVSQQTGTTIRPAAIERLTIIGWIAACATDKGNAYAPEQVEQLVRTLQRKLLLTREIAHMFRVQPTTVIRWADAGKFPRSRTLGGHFRYPALDVCALVE